VSLEGQARHHKIPTLLKGQTPHRVNLRLSQAAHAPLGESPPRSRGRHPLRRISASLEDSTPPRVILRLAQGDGTPSGDSPPRSRAPRAHDARAQSLNQSIKCSDMPWAPGSKANPHHACPLTPPGNHIPALFCQPSP
jgi:hypothetical protein